MDSKEIQSSKAAVSKTLREKFSNRGDFKRQVKKASRHLPKSVLQDAAVIEKAEADLKHPKLRKLVDKDAVHKAKKRILTAAAHADPARERSKFLFNWGSSLVINLVLAMIVIFVLANWLGAF